MLFWCFQSEWNRAKVLRRWRGRLCYEEEPPRTHPHHITDHNLVRTSLIRDYLSLSWNLNTHINHLETSWYLHTWIFNSEYEWKFHLQKQLIFFYLCISFGWLCFQGYKPYCQTSSISCTKSQHLNVSHLSLAIVSAQSIESRC